MKTLVIYTGEKAPDLTKMLPENTKITSISMEDYKQYLDNPFEKQDIILAFHSLQTVEATDVPGVVKKMVRDLNIKGELWIFTPSFEWATAQIGEGAPSPAFHSMLFGSPQYPNRSAFTILWIRSLLEESGLVIRKASHEILELQNGKYTIPVLINNVIGWKFDEPKTAKDAIQ